MSISKFKKQQNDLVERMGVFIENNEGLSPLSARIISTLIMNGSRGITFEEFVELLSASKSSVSTNLNLLVGLNRIGYFTKPGDRKRYYMITPDIILEKTEKMVTRWETEKKLHLEIKEFKTRCNKALAKDSSHVIYDAALHEKYLKFLDGVILLVKGLKDSISNTKQSTIE